MKTIKCLFALLCMTLSARPASVSEPNQVSLHVIAPVLPIWLNISVAGTNPDGTCSLVLERSGDLKNWRSLFNIYSTVPLFRIADLSTIGPDLLPIGGVAAPLFYRGLSPAPSPETMLRNWSDFGLSHYRYKL